MFTFKQLAPEKKGIDHYPLRDVYIQVLYDDVPVGVFSNGLSDQNVFEWRLFGLPNWHRKNDWAVDRNCTLEEVQQSIRDLGEDYFKSSQRNCRIEYASACGAVYYAAMDGPSRKPYHKDPEWMTIFHENHARDLFEKELPEMHLDANSWVVESRLVDALTGEVLECKHHNQDKSIYF